MNAINYIKKYHKPYIGEIDNSYYDNKNHNYQYYFNKYLINYKSIHNENINIFLSHNSRKKEFEKYKLILDKYLNIKNVSNFIPFDNIYYFNNDYVLLNDNLLSNLKYNNLKYNNQYETFTIICNNLILDLNKFQYKNMLIGIICNNIIIKNNINTEKYIFNIHYIKCNNIILQHNIECLEISNPVFIIFNDYKINKLKIFGGSNILQFNNYPIEYLKSLTINRLYIKLDNKEDLNNLQKIINLIIKFHSIKEIFLQFNINFFDHKYIMKHINFQNLKLNILELVLSPYDDTLMLHNIYNIKKIKLNEETFNNILHDSTLLIEHHKFYLD